MSCRLYQMLFPDVLYDFWFRKCNVKGESSIVFAVGSFYVHIWIVQDTVNN